MMASPLIPANSILPAEPPADMPSAEKSVAIVGTEGAGKTVLLTVLTNKLADTKNPTYLECLNRQANRFKNENWEILQNQDWPAGTPEGRHFDLLFRLHSAQGATYLLRALDFSGQNFRKLFASEQINQNRDQLPENLRSLADYLQSARIVIVLINLTDFMDPPDAGTRSDNEWALKYCLDYLKSQHRRVCIVLSQADRYRATISALGGPSGVIEKYLPEVYNAHLRDGQVEVVCVAAVADKVTLANPGEPLREVPAPGFSSEGLDQLVNWIAESADAFQREELQEQQEVAYKQQEEERRWQAEERKKRQSKQIKQILSICAVIGTIFLLWKFSHSSVPPTPPLPAVYVSDIERKPGKLFNLYKELVIAHIKNNDSRTLYVTVRLHYAGWGSGDNPKDKEDKSVTIPARGARTVEFRLHTGQNYGSVSIEEYR